MTDDADWRKVKRAVRESFDNSAKPQGSGWRALCPFCTSSKTGRADYSLGFDRFGRYVCHRCGVGGRVRGSAFAELPEGDGGFPASAALDVGELEMPETMYPLWGEPRSAMVLALASEYAAKRGLTERVCARHRIHAAFGGFWHGRIIVPILADNPDDPWLGFVGRAWASGITPPYRYPMGMQRRTVLFNHRALRRRTEAPVLVVEGVLDAIAHWPNAVAVLGKASAEQKEALLAASRPVAVVLDGDAWFEGWALAAFLRAHGRRAGAVRLPPRADPDEIPPDTLARLAQEAVEGDL